MSQPVVSIITPSFNRADLVGETAKSIFAQHYPHWEWVIVDDGSTDDSWEILEGFAASDARVRVFKRDRGPKGACSCRNIAVERSAGSLLLFLDTDDLLADHCLAQRVQAMQQAPSMDFIIFSMLLFRKQRDDMNLLWNIDSTRDDVERILFGDAVCQGTGTIWKKESFVRIGLWKEDLRLWQDVELHLRSLLEGLKYTKRFDLPPDIFLRVTEVSLSRTGFHAPEKLVSRITVLRETGARMLEKGNQRRYQRGLRSMFIDLFHNGVVSRQYAALAELQVLDRAWELFSSQERAWMRAFTLVYRLRGYRIPGLSGLLIRRIRALEPKPESSLNRVVFQPAQYIQPNTSSS